MTEFTAETVVQEQVPELDGCPILGQVLAYVVPGGTLRTLEHVFKNSNGQPINLGEEGSGETESSLSESESLPGNVHPGGHVWVRIREALSLDRQPTARLPLYNLPAYALHPSEGIVRVDLPANLMNKPGVYVINWAVKDQTGNIILMDESCLLVERSLWIDSALRVKGPPPFNAIRLSLRDFPENNLVLQAYEFTGAEILQAITRPIAEWNQFPPPVGIYDSTNFPYTEPWLVAIQSQLMFMAAHLFRRNKLPYTAGGLSINDQAKEPEYMTAAQALALRYSNWMQRTKVAINAQLAIGSVGSPYGGWYNPQC